MKALMLISLLFLGSSAPALTRCPVVNGEPSCEEFAPQTQYTNCTDRMANSACEIFDPKNASAFNENDVVRFLPKWDNDQNN